MALDAESEAIGNLLYDRGILTDEQLDEAEDLAEAWNLGLVEVLLGKRWLKAATIYRELAYYYDVPLLDLSETPADTALLRRYDVTEMTEAQVIPVREENGRLTVATARPGPVTLVRIIEIFGSEVDIAVATRLDISLALQSAFREEQSHEAVYGLAETDPVMSASNVILPAQVVVLYGCISLFLLGLAFAPVPTLIALNVVMTVFYLGNFLFKATLVWVGSEAQERMSQSIAAEAAMLHDDELPVYTVLVPMFREPDVLPILANALRELDYPTSRLDIKIVLEEGDQLTIDAATALGLEDIFEIILVPPSQPQTKPKACNYALQFARGEYLVIYDAEDKPEPDQLKKVVVTFDRAPDNVACVQCRLNYFNRDENWLTRLFTLDYSLWFDLMLPGLEKLKVPIPLGGTSNHFKMDVLRELRAWDPFNVTEDADLGIRLTQKGYEVRLAASTTYEEANVSQSNWIRQRSRWIKGYMQTFLVHTRRPIHLMKTIGPLGVLGFIFFIGGTMLSGLLNPLFWLIFIFWLLTESGVFDPLFPPVLLYLSLFNLLAGNGLFMFIMMLAPFRRNWLSLAPYSLTVFWYWVLMSVAAWKGAWQLITKPFYWEKTEHGLSKHTASEVSKAQAGQLAG